MLCIAGMLSTPNLAYYSHIGYYACYPPHELLPKEPGSKSATKHSYFVEDWSGFTKSQPQKVAEQTLKSACKLAYDISQENIDLQCCEVGGGGCLFDHHEYKYQAALFLNEAKNHAKSEEDFQFKEIVLQLLEMDKLLYPEIEDEEESARLNDEPILEEDAEYEDNSPALNKHRKPGLEFGFQSDDSNSANNMLLRSAGGSGEDLSNILGKSELHQSNREQSDKLQLVAIPVPKQTGKSNRDLQTAVRDGQILSN